MATRSAVDEAIEVIGHDGVQALNDRGLMVTRAVRYVQNARDARAERMRASTRLANSYAPDYDEDEHEGNGLAELVDELRYELARERLESLSFRMLAEANQIRSDTLQERLERGEGGVLRVVVERPDLLPERKTPGSAGLDLATKGNVVLVRGYVAMVGTGVRVAIPEGHVGLVYSRSSTASKLRVRLANSVGVIDSDYRGEIMLPLVYEGLQDSYLLEAGTRVAQLIVQPYVPLPVEVVDELDETERGDGGFGSTGDRNEANGAVTITLFQSDDGAKEWRITGKNKVFTPTDPRVWGDQMYRVAAREVGVPEGDLYRAVREFLREGATDEPA